MANVPTALLYHAFNQVTKDAAPLRPKPVVKKGIEYSLDHGQFQVEQQGQTEAGETVLLVTVDRWTALLVDKKVVEIFDAAKRDAALALFNKTIKHGAKEVHPYGVDESCEVYTPHVTMEPMNESQLLGRGIWVLRKKGGGKFYVKGATSNNVSWAFAPNAAVGNRTPTSQFIQDFTALDGSPLVAPEAKDNSPKSPAGTCSFCFNVQQTEPTGNKNRPRTMVDHGYKVPNWGRGGYRQGRCPGTQYMPYELSTEGCKVYLGYAENEIQNCDRLLAQRPSQLPDPDVYIVRRPGDDSPRPMVKSTGEPGDHHQPLDPKIWGTDPAYIKGIWQRRYDKALQIRRLNIERDKKQAESTRDFLRGKINAWSLKPLFHRLTGKPYEMDESTELPSDKWLAGPVADKGVRCDGPCKKKLDKGSTVYRRQGDREINWLCFDCKENERTRVGKLRTAQEIAALHKEHGVAETTRPTVEQVAALLRGLNTKFGSMSQVRIHREGWIMVDAEPRGRQRLDHYGNDGDGWDDEGWSNDYASPLHKQVMAALDSRFPGHGLQVEIDEKGWVDVTGWPDKKTEGFVDDAHDAATSPLNLKPEPTKAEKRSGEYQTGRMVVQGLQVRIENPKGSVRKGDGYENDQMFHYGYIVGTDGADGEEVDCFVGPNPDSEKVFIVNQVDKDGQFDEHKVMIGFLSVEEAKGAYLSAYEPGWVCGPISTMTVPEFKQWLFARSK